MLPEVFAELPCTEVDDLLMHASYEAARERRWEREAELKAQHASAAAENKSKSKSRGRLGTGGPPHIPG